MDQPFSLNHSVSKLVERVDLPLLLVTGDRVALANPAAMALLGEHILGQDVRLAIRHPIAVELVSTGSEGAVEVPGLSTPTSVWLVSVRRLDQNWRLVELRDKSAQSDVSRAHTDFVANASHELRTPLAAILGYVETLAEPQAGGDRATRERFLGIVEREARRLQRLVEDLMSLSRIEAVKHDRPHEVVDLAALARDVVSDVNIAHDGAERALIEEAEPARVSGDPGQLSQLVRNLVDNAIRHGGASEPVRVSVREEVERKLVYLTVADRGAGIAPEHLPRLTERFYRVDASRSRDAGGTGLGLAIVKHIVERHRGQIDIDSEVGKGTTVRIRFPTASGGDVIKLSSN